ncbi:hypothetical protein BJ742DRAFT_321088 [Cladochytrium replicatum]|nr:hypothetical protein BJ742DRAFT_321088 [Cladochytrium replicatum]
MLVSACSIRFDLKQSDTKDKLFYMPIMKHFTTGDKQTLSFSLNSFEAHERFIELSQSEPPLRGNIRRILIIEKVNKRVIIISGKLDYLGHGILHLDRFPTTDVRQPIHAVSKKLAPAGAAAGVLSQSTTMAVFIAVSLGKRPHSRNWGSCTHVRDPYHDPGVVARRAVPDVEHSYGCGNQPAVDRERRERFRHSPDQLFSGKRCTW